MGMGGAPIAEWLELPWLVLILQWMSYVSIAGLVLAVLFIGGLGLYHGILTIFGLEVRTMDPKPAPTPLPSEPRVERSENSS